MNILDNDSPNDTQPISPHIHEDVPSAAYQTGQTGHVDLVRGFEQSIIERQPASQDDFDEDTDPLSQPMQVRAEPFPEEKRFQGPRTPAMTGQKRDRAGKAVSQYWSTPSLPRNPFGNSKAGLQGVMNASQVFKATQYSSPLPQPLLSDAITERPSPVLIEVRRPSTPDNLSSPARLNDMLSPPTRYEPRDRYISVKESQARRQRLEKTLGDELIARDNSDEEFDSDGSLVRRKRIRQRQEQKARAELSTVKASHGAATPRSRKQALRRHQLDSIPDIQRVGNKAEEIVVSSDEAAPVDDLTEEETEREDEPVEVLSDSSMDELAEENKENIAAFGIQVPRTTSKAKVGKKLTTVSQPTPSHRRTREREGSHSLVTHDAVIASIAVPSSNDVLQLSTTNEDSVAVADSQLVCTHQHTQPPNLVTFDGRQSLDASKSLKEFVPTSQPFDQENAMPSRSLAEINIQVREVADTGRSLSPNLSGRTTVAQAEIIRQPPDKSPAVSSSSQQHAAAAHSIAEGIPLRIGQAGTSSESGEAAFDASVVATSQHNEENRVEERLRSIISDTESALNARRSNNTTTSIRTIGTSSTPGSARLQNHALPNTKTSSRQSTTFETAPSSLKQPSTSTTKENQLPRSSTLPKTTGNSNQQENHGNSRARDARKTFQTAIESSSAVAPYRPRRRKQQPNQVLMSSPEPRVARDTTDDELALSTAPTSTPVSSAPSVEDPTLYALRGAPLFPSSPPTKALSKTKENHPSDDNEGAPNSKTSTFTESLPNRVLAHFNGKLSAYYPATCMGIIGGDEPRYKVRFDDAGEDIVNAYGIKRLELKSGDPVKIDAMHLRKHTYVVEEMGDQQAAPLFPEEDEVSREQAQKRHGKVVQATDIHGNTMVTLSLKPIGPEVIGKIAKKLLVPIDRIYVTQSMWASYKDRTFTFTDSDVRVASGPQTPADPGSAVVTPTSRCARTKPLAIAPLRQIQSSQSKHATLFGNMVFAITNVSSDEARKTVGHDIDSHGGQILDARFDDLFRIPDLTAIKGKERPHLITPSGGFKLREEVLNLEFACVIADKHCRMAKYIQALALGIPCLSRRWISDCVAKQQVLPWRPYLLAAGESSYLYDAVVSRTFEPLPQENISLAAMIDARPRLLDGQTLLLIMSKREEEKMKHMPLISHALGAIEISRVQSVEEAAKAVAQARIEDRGQWDWVYSHDDTEHVTALLSGRTSRKGKRLRKSECLGESLALPRVVGNEFVIQSLIAGRLVVED